MDPRFDQMFGQMIFEAHCVGGVGGEKHLKWTARPGPAVEWERNIINGIRDCHLKNGSSQRLEFGLDCLISFQIAWERQ